MTQETPSGEGGETQSGASSEGASGETQSGASSEGSSGETQSGVTYTQEELEAMLKADLLTLAESLGITEVTNSNTKAEIIEAILAAQSAEG